LELVIVGITNCVITVIIILQVDLQRIVLTRIRVDPEIEMITSGQVTQVCPAKTAEETRSSSRAPASLQRESTAVTGREVDSIGTDSPAANRASKRKPSIIAWISVFHIVKYDGRCGREGLDCKECSH
jgi:hypothetical protein